MSTSVRDLVAWQQAMDLVELIYKATAKFPREEIYGLTAQVRRAAVSVASNIAEGQGRNSPKEFIYFLGMARGSLTEVETQVLIAGRLKWMDEASSEAVLKQIERVRRLVNGLILSFQKKSKSAQAGE
jgi:four helix bundle protein